MTLEEMLPKAVNHPGLRNVTVVTQRTPFGELDLVLPPGVFPTDGDPKAAIELLRRADAALQAQDWATGERLIDEAIRAHQLVPAAYEMAKAMWIARGDAQRQAFYARQLVAVQPTFANLTELAIALGRCGELESSIVICAYQWKHRAEHPRHEVEAAIDVFLISLHRHKNFTDMVEVASRAIAEYGLRARLLYQQVLGTLLLNDWEGAKPILARRSEIPESDPFRAKLQELADEIAQHDRKVGQR
jgi:hypothetical protein